MLNTTGTNGHVHGPADMSPDPSSDAGLRSDRLHTVEDVAQVLEVTHRQVTRLVKQGRLEGTALSVDGHRRLMIPDASLRRYMAERAETRSTDKSPAPSVDRPGPPDVFYALATPSANRTDDMSADRSELFQAYTTAVAALMMSERNVGWLERHNEGLMEALGQHRLALTESGDSIAEREARARQAEARAELEAEALATAEAELVELRARLAELEAAEARRRRPWYRKLFG